jgi:sulfatase maturation enzyme AslB (radical SAM superfamily)
MNTRDVADQTSKLPVTPPAKFCIAPFQSIRQNAYGRNSPCAFGAGEWRQGDLSPAERWNSAELNKLRMQFINGEQPETCHRCWDEEAAGKESLRQRQYQYFPTDYENIVRSGKWVNGPRTAVFKSSNVCNLACRSCAGWDTNWYKKEGLYYADRYQTLDTVDGTTKLHNRFIPLLQPKHMDFMNYEDIVDNLQKIDFYGGEPFLNITQLDLLEHLASKGLSKNITLFYSTNATNYPTDRLKRALDKFKRIEISMSIDGIGDKFEYMRWPGKWSEAEAVVKANMSLALDAEMYFMASHTVSTLNAYYADETTAWLKSEIGDIYINMVDSPSYLSIHAMPERAKNAVKNNTSNQEILGYIDIKEHNPLLWKQFIIWTKRQDEYRKQNFAVTFPEFFSLIEDDWNSVTDLSEENYYKE